MKIADVFFMLVVFMLFGGAAGYGFGLDQVRGEIESEVTAAHAAECQENNILILNGDVYHCTKVQPGEQSHG